MSRSSGSVSRASASWISRARSSAWPCALGVSSAAGWKPLAGPPNMAPSTPSSRSNLPGGIRCRAPRSRRVEAQARDDAGQPGAEHRQGLRLVGDPLKLIEFLPGAQPRLLNQVGRTAVGPVRAGLLPRERFEPGSDAREQFLRGGVVAGAGTGEQVSEAGDVVHVGRLYAVRDCDAR